MVRDQLSELKAELVARGLDSLTTARQGHLISNARAELDRMFLWPWRAKSVTAVSPISITDLGRVETPSTLARWARLAAKLTPTRLATHSSRDCYPLATRWAGNRA